MTKRKTASTDNVIKQIKDRVSHLKSGYSNDETRDALGRVEELLEEHNGKK